MGRLIDADEYEKRIKPYDTEDVMDKALYNFAHRKLIATPTAEKTGKWIAMSDTDGVYWTCSECGEEIPRISHYNPQFDLFPRLESINKTNYCPNCGAKMEEETK